MSQITKKNKKLYILFTIISIALNVGPIVVYAIIAFVNGEPKQKLALGGTITVAMILLALNTIFKYHIRSTLYIIMLGIYLCLKDIATMLLIIAILTIIDEFVVSPLKKRYKESFKINKEIDRRMP